MPADERVERLCLPDAIIPPSMVLHAPFSMTAKPVVRLESAFSTLKCLTLSFLFTALLSCALSHIQIRVRSLPLECVRKKKKVTLKKTRQAGRQQKKDCLSFSSEMCFGQAVGNGGKNVSTFSSEKRQNLELSITESYNDSGLRVIALVMHFYQYTCDPYL